MTTLTPPQLTFYSRTGCHLCEEAEALLVRLAAELGVVAEMTVIDLADEPEYEASYGHRVPVIETAGRGEVLEAPITEDALRQLLLQLKAGAH